MENYIKECLGVDVLERKYTLPKEFPMYLKNNYSYSLLTIHGVDCLFVKPKEFSLPIYKKPLIQMMTGLHQYISSMKYPVFKQFCLMMNIIIS